jgi:hypothetical protein
VRRATRRFEREASRESHKPSHGCHACTGRSLRDRRRDDPVRLGVGAALIVEAFAINRVGVKGVMPASGRRSEWRSSIELVVALTPVAGALLFVVLRVYLNEFYGGLGVDPDQVGLGYAATLTSSIGVLVFLALAVVIAPAVILACAYAAIRVARSSAPVPLRRLPATFGSPTVAFLQRVLPLATIACVALFAIFFAGKGEHYADAVKDGRPIRFGQLALTSFKLRATPIRVAPLVTPAESPALDAVARRSRGTPPLLYLGQAGGNVVAYDSVVQRAIQFPADAAVLETSNCEMAPSSDSACRRAID